VRTGGRAGIVARGFLPGARHRLAAGAVLSPDSAEEAEGSGNREDPDSFTSLHTRGLSASMIRKYAGSTIKETAGKGPGFPTRIDTAAEADAASECSRYNLS